MSGLDLSKFDRRFVPILIDRQKVKVRVIIVENEDNQKETLFMTHGFGMFATTYFELIKRLHKHFRIILFDNTGFGANTRI